MWNIWNTTKCAYFHLAARVDWLLFNRSSEAFVKNAGPIRLTLWKILLIYRFSRMLFEKRTGFFRLLSVNNRLTRHSRSGKQVRLGHVIETRELSRGRSLRSIHLIWFLTTWITVDNSSKCVFVLISILGRVKNRHLLKSKGKPCQPESIRFTFTAAAWNSV